MELEEKMHRRLSSSLLSYSVLKTYVTRLVISSFVTRHLDSAYEQAQFLDVVQQMNMPAWSRFLYSIAFGGQQTFRGNWLNYATEESCKLKAYSFLIYVSFTLHNKTAFVTETICM